MKDFLIRCSSLSKILTEPKSKSDKECGNLSETAKSHIQELVGQMVLNYQTPELTGKEIKKGLMQEQSAIDLLNICKGTMYQKNTTRYYNKWITGEPDIVDDIIIDLKCPWSKITFPITSDIARKISIKSGYDYQMAGYMMLTGIEVAHVCFCLVDTPSELIPPWEGDMIHDVRNLKPSHRITSVTFERDLAIEEKIKLKCAAAQAYANELISQFELEHS